jgi:hypothetical protein
VLQGWTPKTADFLNNLFAKGVKGLFAVVGFWIGGCVNYQLYFNAIACFILV